MAIRNVVHKALRRLFEEDDDAGLLPDLVLKLRRILSYLQDMDSVDEQRAVPGWRTHQLTGDRKGTWSLTVTRNWRITFRIDGSEEEIVDLDCEDYH